MSRELLQRARYLLEVGIDTESALWKRAVTVIEEIEAYLFHQPKQEPFICGSCGIGPMYQTPQDQSARIAETEHKVIDWQAMYELQSTELHNTRQQLIELQAKLEPLSDAGIKECYEAALNQSLRPQDSHTVFKFARAIEAAHGITGEYK